PTPPPPRYANHMKTRMSISGASLATALVVAACSHPKPAATPAPATTPAPSNAAPGRGGPLPGGFQLPQQGGDSGGRGGPPGAAAAPRPYNRVITAEAKTRRGMLITHQVGERTLRWERNGNHVILRSPSYAITADSGTSMFRSVENSNYGPIIAMFN